MVSEGMTYNDKDQMKKKNPPLAHREKYRNHTDTQRQNKVEV